MYALLIGINEYASPSIKTLNGCANDADAMAELLRERFGVSTDNILVLKNNEATHERIEQAFRSQLINRARDAAASGDTETAFLFHYSGHGSQAPDATGSEPDGMDETIVPHDSRTEGVEDIKDWELGLWLEELTGFCKNVTVIMDCCHSGSGTREVVGASPPTRRCPADTRPQSSRRPVVPGRRSVAGASGWRHNGGYALFAGCRDGEESNEHMGWQGRSLGRHGAMSYFLINQLADMSPNQTLTYRELHRTIHREVNVAYPNQFPCCEGDIDREVFGGLRPVREAFFNVVHSDSELATINAGKVHGITMGTLLRAYAPGTRTLHEAGEPLATLLVDKVGGAESVCSIVEQGAEVPVGAQAVIHRAAPGDRRYTVALEIASAELKDNVQQRLGGNDIAAKIQVLARARDPANFTVRVGNERLILLDSMSHILSHPFDVDALAADLAHVIRYKNVARLSGPTPSEKGAAIQLEVKELEIINGEATAKPFAVNPNAELVIEDATCLVFEITNRCEQDLFFALLNLSSEWAVQPIYPTQSAHEILPAGKTFILGLSTTFDDQFPAQLSAVSSQSSEIVKVIATSADTDFELLYQDELGSAHEGNSTNSRSTNSALGKLFETNTGDARQARSANASDEVWSTDQINLTIRSL